MEQKPSRDEIARDILAKLVCGTQASVFLNPQARHYIRHLTRVAYESADSLIDAMGQAAGTPVKFSRQLPPVDPRATLKDSEWWVE